MKKKVIWISIAIVIAAILSAYIFGYIHKELEIYVFSIDIKFEKELDKGIVSDELRKELEREGFIFPDNFTIIKKYGE